MVLNEFLNTDIKVCMYKVVILSVHFPYRIVGMFGGKFGKLSAICQTETIQILYIINTLMAESIHLANFFLQPLNLSNINPTKHLCYTVYVC